MAPDIEAAHRLLVEQKASAGFWLLCRIALYPFICPYHLLVLLPNPLHGQVVLEQVAVTLSQLLHTEH